MSKVKITNSISSDLFQGESMPIDVAVQELMLLSEQDCSHFNVNDQALRIDADRAMMGRLLELLFDKGLIDISDINTVVKSTGVFHEIEACQNPDLLEGEGND